VGGSKPKGFDTQKVVAGTFPNCFFILFVKIFREFR